MKTKGFSANAIKSKGAASLICGLLLLTAFTSSFPLILLMQKLKLKSALLSISSIYMYWLFATTAIVSNAWPCL